MSLIYAEVVGDRIALTLPTTWNDMARKIPGARYKQGWTVPLSWAACKQMRDVFGESLGIGPDLVAWAGEHLASRQRIIDIQGGNIPGPMAEVLASWRDVG